MALVDTLFPASFKGIPFLIRDTSTSGGRKDVRHEFPNSDKQNIEDLGLSPRIYRIGAIISEPGYILKRNLLLEALESGETGIMTHPFYGLIKDIKCRTFTLNETVTLLGETTIDCVFEVSDSDGLPSQILNILSSIALLKDVLTGAITLDIPDFFRVNNRLSGNHSSASAKLNQVADTVTANTKSLTATPDQINDFSSLVNNFQASINLLIVDTERLGEDMQEIFAEIPGLYATPEEQTAALSLFFDFGDDDPVITETTAGLAERNQNNNVINNAVKGFALGGAYVSAAQIEFVTVADVENTADILEAAFQSIKSASGLSSSATAGIPGTGIGSTGNALSSETINNLEDLRTRTQSFFDEQKISAKQIISVQTQELPAAIISFQYYGDSSQAEQISRLNNEINVSNLKGDIDILTV